ncbi:DUF2789 family protein [Vibrio hibernica]|uniref:DUF2789 family protein n=1 Tax=Vibrio hibernica TaxID=2587465 RepID=UPI0039AEA9BD
MEMHNHTLTALFEQLGLGSSESEIEMFIEQHRDGLAHTSKLHHAEFWSHSQAEFLKESKSEDADWASVVDQLDALFRAPGK